MLEIKNLVGQVEKEKIQFLEDNIDTKLITIITNLFTIEPFIHEHGSKGRIQTKEKGILG